MMTSMACIINILVINDAISGLYYKHITVVNDDINGLYYKHITIVNDDISGLHYKHITVINDDISGLHYKHITIVITIVNYECKTFIVQTSDRNFFLRHWSCHRIS
jgi:hypothetical protein